jgi:cell division transport system permease protein
MNPRLHAQALSEALRRMASQPLATATFVVVLGLALAIPLVAAVLLRSVSAAAAHLDTDPHVNVYLSVDASDDEAKRVGDALRASPESAAVRFVPKSQALAELKATTHLAEVLASLDRNPLPHAFTVRVRSAEPARLAALKAAWLQLPKVDQVVADFEWSQRLARWVQFGERLVYAIGTLLGLAIFFVVGQLIRLQVVTQRAEIEVSQLIGATASDVRRRFLYHGALQGALAGAAAVTIAAGVGAWLNLEVQALTPQYAADFKVLSLSLAAAAILAACAGFLGFIGAWLAVDRELRTFAGHR